MNPSQSTGQCTNCQQLNPITATHCEFCGQKLPWTTNRTSTPAPRAPKTPDLTRHTSADPEPTKPATEKGGLSQAVINLVLGGLACGIGTALPYAAVALYMVLHGNEIQKTDSIGKALGFGFFGAVFGWFAVITLGRQAATLIIPPVLFVLSLYFLIQYG